MMLLLLCKGTRTGGWVDAAEGSVVYGCLEVLTTFSPARAKEKATSWQKDVSDSHDKWTVELTKRCACVRACVRACVSSVSGQ
jgi:hypothetical protein